jgi:hypothetical protein
MSWGARVAENRLTREEVALIRGDSGIIKMPTDPGCVPGAVGMFFADGIGLGVLPTKLPDI